MTEQWCNLHNIHKLRIEELITIVQRMEQKAHDEIHP